MIKLEQFDGEHKTVLENVINNKTGDRKDLLLNLKEYVENRYDQYDELNDNLENIDATTINLDVPKDTKENKYEKNALIHMYNSQEENAKKYLEDIKAELEEGSLCPYCAINDSEQIDHFLPKAKFPEFSLYLPNLVISCPRCNKKKDDICLDLVNNKRLIINPYFDREILDKDFISCKILPPFQASKFNIIINLEDENKEIFEKHIEILKLKKKIKKLWKNYFSELSKRLEHEYIENFHNVERSIVIGKFKEIIQNEIRYKSIRENVIHKSFFVECSTNTDLLEFWYDNFRDLKIKILEAVNE